MTANECRRYAPATTSKCRVGVRRMQRCPGEPPLTDAHHDRLEGCLAVVPERLLEDLVEHTSTGRFIRGLG